MLLLSCATSCRSNSTKAQTERANEVTRQHKLPDTLRVTTLYSPTSYFVYRDTEMGYDYNLVTQFATDKGMAIDLTVAPSLSAMIELLDSGKVDLIAYEMPVIAEYKAHAVACGPENFNSQVLVQLKSDTITDVTQLAGRDVYVEKNSKYELRLQNLNDEIGGGIKIHPVDRDTLITEDLIAMVSSGEIPLTVVDSDIARINKTYYRDLNISLQLSFPQRSSWAVSPKQDWLADTINQWFSQENQRQTQAELLKRYFEMSKSEPSLYNYDFSGGVISRFDHLFKKYAKTIDYDWRMLAAQAYVESKFDSTAVSWAGARGLMQIMPSSARAYGLSYDKMSHSEPSIATSVKIIDDINKRLAELVPNKTERVKFIIASYNSGIAHILDAIALAKKYGKNPQVWSGNVEEAMMMKSKPEYYNDPVCKYGYFRGRQTREYVTKVMDFYNKASSKIKL